MVYIVSNISDHNTWCPGVGLIYPHQSIEISQALATSLTHQLIPSVALQMVPQQQWDLYQASLEQQEHTLVSA